MRVQSGIERPRPAALQDRDQRARGEVLPAVPDDQPHPAARAGVREFTDEFVASAPVQQMMPRVTNIFDPKIEAQGFDKIRSVVEVDLVDGRTLVQAADERYRGGPDKPFTPAELHGKFADCAQLTMGPARIDRVLERIEGRGAAERRRRTGARRRLTAWPTWHTNCV